MHVLVMAKSPVPGRVKTRLCPPLSPAEAAALAEASLATTLEAVAMCSASRRLLALDGEPGDWLPPGFTVFAQEGATFSERLWRAWTAAGGPGLQIGMDTPQLGHELLDSSLSMLSGQDCTAVLGPALDGGWWALGLRHGWDKDVFANVPMSTAETFARQRASLVAAGHEVGLLPALRDIDTVDDLWAVAAEMPGSRLGLATESFGALR